MENTRKLHPNNWQVNERLMIRAFEKKLESDEKIQKMKFLGMIALVALGTFGVLVVPVIVNYAVIMLLK